MFTCIKDIAEVPLYDVYENINLSVDETPVLRLIHGDGLAGACGDSVRGRGRTPFAAMRDADRREEFVCPLSTDEWLAKAIVDSTGSHNFPWFRPDGNPNPSWRLFTGETFEEAENAAFEAAKGKAWDATRNEAWRVAWAAAQAAKKGYYSWAAIRDAAWDAYPVLPRGAAEDIACDFLVRHICSDLQIAAEHRAAMAARMEVWKKGYFLLCEAEGILYVYAKTA